MEKPTPLERINQAEREIVDEEKKKQQDVAVSTQEDVSWGSDAYLDLRHVNPKAN